LKFRLGPIQILLKCNDNTVNKLHGAVLELNCFMLEETYELVPVRPFELMFEVIIGI
jgi:hypothetical protein